MNCQSYYISCEGKTEIWYFQWLQKKINDDPRTVSKVKFIIPPKGHTPSSYAKSNKGAFSTPCKRFCRVQDIEDYSKYHIDNLHTLAANTKWAKKQLPNCDFYIACSNFTFEIWIIAHKTKVPAVVDRDKYFVTINKAYGTEFRENAEYKEEKNFKALLDTLTLNDVIENAIPECERIRQNNATNHQTAKRQYGGYTYYLNNPDTDLHEFIKTVLRDAGLI